MSRHLARHLARLVARIEAEMADQADLCRRLPSATAHGVLIGLEVARNLVETYRRQQHSTCQARPAAYTPPQRPRTR